MIHKTSRGQFVQVSHSRPTEFPTTETRDLPDIFRPLFRRDFEYRIHNRYAQNLAPRFDPYHDRKECLPFVCLSDIDCIYCTNSLVFVSLMVPEMLLGVMESRPQTSLSHGLPSWLLTLADSLCSARTIDNFGVCKEQISRTRDRLTWRFLEEKACDGQRLFDCKFSHVSPFPIAFSSSVLGGIRRAQVWPIASYRTISLV
jgi:hypothetical protein